MLPIVSAIDRQVDMNALRFSADTRSAAYHDPEIAHFIERASAARLPPSVFQTLGRLFPSLIPEALWDAPMLLHWLGHEYAQAINELAYARLATDVHHSTDGQKRRPVLAWNTRTQAFCTSARALAESLNSACNAQILAIFISPEGFACNPAWVSEDLLDELNARVTGPNCQLRAGKQNTLEELSSALLRSVLFGNEPKEDGEGREIILLKTCTLPRNWYS